MTFANAATRASAHYVVRASDGHVTQMVSNDDVAWHAGNWWVNSHAIGIELEGVATIDGNSWYGDALYRSLARLIGYLADRYDIPVDRAHILGHDEVPGPIASFQAGMHWDPGPFFDWSRLMRMATGPARPHGWGDAVTIAPRFRRNRPPVSSCDAAGCRTLPSQPANFVYLYSAPSADSQLVGDPALAGTALEPDGNGSTQANDWGDKAISGQTFAVLARHREWTAIWYAGREAWLYNPRGINATATCAPQITPKTELAAIPVYGRAYPPSVSTGTLGYSIAAGQRYVAYARVPADYYRASVFNAPETYAVISDPVSAFYEISFNHRHAFVNASDVTLVTDGCGSAAPDSLRPQRAQTSARLDRTKNSDALFGRP